MVERLVCIQYAQGSIPWSSNFLLNEIDIKTSGYSSVGRAGDCSCLKLKSLGHWFDSGWPDFLFSFVLFLLLLHTSLYPHCTSYFKESDPRLQTQCVRVKGSVEWRHTLSIKHNASDISRQTQSIGRNAFDTMLRTQRDRGNVSDSMIQTQCFRRRQSDAMRQTHSVKRIASYSKHQTRCFRRNASDAMLQTH